MPSTLPELNGAKGLFAYDPRQPAGAVVFKVGDIICKYEGEMLTEAQLNERYNYDGEEYTAPYGLEQSRDKNIDCSCRRGIGSLANHSNRNYNDELRPSHSGRGANRVDFVVLRARRIIYNRQEILLVNYGREYGFDEPTSHSTKYISNRQADNIN